MIVIRTNLAVCVGLKAKKLCILAFIIHSLYPFLSDSCSTLCVVSYDLGDSDAALVDLTVDKECGDSGVFCFLNSLYGSISTCVVADDCCSAVGDSCFKILKLFCCVVIM